MQQIFENLHSTSQNTQHSHHHKPSVNAVEGNKRCLSCGSHETSAFCVQNYKVQFEITWFTSSDCALQVQHFQYAVLSKFMTTAVTYMDRFMKEISENGRYRYAVSNDSAR